MLNLNNSYMLILNNAYNIGLFALIVLYDTRDAQEVKAFKIQVDRQSVTFMVVEIFLVPNR